MLSQLLYCYNAVTLTTCKWINFLEMEFLVLQIYGFFFSLDTYFQIALQTG